MRRDFMSFEDLLQERWADSQGGPVTITEDDESIELTFEIDRFRRQAMTIDKSRGGTIRRMQKVVDMPAEHGGKHFGEDHSFEWKQISDVWVPVKAVYSAQDGASGFWTKTQVQLTIHWETVNGPLPEQEFTQDRWSGIPWTRIENHVEQQF